MAKKAAPKAKKGKKPTKGNMAKMEFVAMKKAPAEGEVGGKTSPGAWYVCWACGAANYVPYGWDYFYCWNDHALNWV